MNNIILIILTIAVALPLILIPSILLTRVNLVLLVLISALSFNAMYVQAIGSSCTLIQDLHQVTSVSQSFDTFIFLVVLVLLYLNVLRMLVAPVRSELMAHASDILITPMHLNHRTVAHCVVLYIGLIFTYSLILTVDSYHEVIMTLNNMLDYLNVLSLHAWNIIKSNKLYYLLSALIYILGRILAIHGILICVSYYAWCINLTKQGPLELYYKLVRLLHIAIFVRLCFLISLYSECYLGSFSYYYANDLMGFSLLSEPLVLRPWLLNCNIYDLLSSAISKLLLLIINPIHCEGEFISWNNTLSLSKGIEALNRMHRSLSSSDPLKIFLDSHCKHLLYPLIGNTNIPISYANPRSLLDLDHTVKLEPTYTPSQFKGLHNLVGVYAFYSEDATHVTQVGSTVRFLNRMHTHYIEAGSEYYLSDNKYIYDYHWTPVRFANNYVALYNSDHRMTPREEYILNSFTQQEIRSIEQAYSNYANPLNYNGKEINTWHNNWQEGFSGNNNTSKRVTWTTQEGKIFTRQTIEAACDQLNTDPKTLKKYRTIEGLLFVSKEYGPISVNIEGIQKVHVSATDRYTTRYGTSPNTSVDTSHLLPNHYYLYDKDMNQLPYGPYKTSKDVNLAMGLSAKYKGTKMWCNYMHMIKAIRLGISVYIVKNAEDTKVPVIVTAVDSGQTTEYESLRKALARISPKLKSGIYTDRKIVNNTAFIGIDGKAYLCQYKNSRDLENAKTRVNNKSPNHFKV